MKYTKSTINKIIGSLQQGDGRVRACKAANIHYSTFLEWIEKKSDFSELVKKAEEVGYDRLKDLARRGVVEKFASHWQAAAWWLERKFPEEFGRREAISHSGDMIIGINVIDAKPEGDDASKEPDG